MKNTDLRINEDYGLMTDPAAHDPPTPGDGPSARSLPATA